MPDHDDPEPGGWAYVSLVSIIPGLADRPTTALAIQFTAFEAATILLAAVYGQWTTVPIATAAIAIAAIGSWMMLSLSRRIHATNTTAAYRNALFHSSIDVVMGLVAFIAFITYLIADATTTNPGLLDTLLGPDRPAPAVFLTLLVAWDLCYRIGVGWWTSVTGLWRTITTEQTPTSSDRGTLLRTDLQTIAFAGLQLVLVPFLLPYPILALLLGGHVLAVFAVSGLSIALLRN